MSITVVALGVAALMLMFLFVDATSGKQRNQKIMLAEFSVLVIALLVAFVTYLLGGM